MAKYDLDIRKDAQNGNEIELLKDVYMNYFQNIACTMFDWHNMGNQFDARFAEAALFWNGWVTICWDDLLESFVCGNTIAGGADDGVGFNMYGDYTSSQINAVNGYNRMLNKYNSVIVYNDFSRISNTATGATPFSPKQYLEHIVSEMAYTQETKMVNLTSMGSPLIFTGTDEQRLSLFQMIEKFVYRKRFIMLNKEQFDKDDIKAVDTGVQCWLQNLDDSFERARNKGLTYLGVNNAMTSKRERLIVDEVNANNAEISTMAMSKLISRNTALEKLNKIFGSKCYVTLRESAMPFEDADTNNKDTNDYERPEREEGVDE